MCACVRVTRARPARSSQPRFFQTFFYGQVHAEPLDSPSKLPRHPLRLLSFTNQLSSHRTRLFAAVANATAAQALELLAAARTAGMSPNVVAFTTAIEACATAGKFDSVLSLLEQMSAEGVSPSVVTFSSALK